MPGVAMHEVERTPTHCRHTIPGMKRDTTDESIIVRYSPQADVVTNRMDSKPYVQPKSDGMRQAVPVFPRHRVQAICRNVARFAIYRQTSS